MDKGKKENEMIVVINMKRIWTTKDKNNICSVCTIYIRMVKSIKVRLNKLNGQINKYIYINNYRIVETRSFQHSKKFELKLNLCLSSTNNA